MGQELTFRAANLADLPIVADLLKESGLPLAGVEEHLGGFLLSFEEGSLTGCAGLERYGSIALLRSVAVASEQRRRGLGQELVRRALVRARAEGIKSVLLLTTTAAHFFQRFGFVSISRAEVPGALRCSAELQGACPDSATVMKIDLADAG